MIQELANETMVISPWILVTLGGFVGVISGLLGVGGGIIMTPALHILGLPIASAVGTTLTQMVASSISGTWKHHRQRNVSWPLVFAFGVPGVLGVVLGKELMVFLSASQDRMSSLSLVYAIFLFFLAISMVKRQLAYRGKAEPSKSIWEFGPRWVNQELSYTVYLAPCIILGSLVGVVSALTGMGGGFFYLPIMSQVFRVPLKIAVGSSLAIVVVSSSTGAVTYSLAGVADFKMAAFIAMGAIVGSYTGASATQYVKAKNLRLMFSSLVFAAAFSMGFKYINLPLVSFYTLLIPCLLLFTFSLANAFKNYRLEKA